MIGDPDKYGRAKMAGKEYQALLRMFAAKSSLLEIDPVLWDRMGLVKNARRDFRLAIALLEKVSEAILSTIPTNKLLSMRRELGAVRVRIQIGPDAAPQGADQVIYVREDAFLRLLDQIVGMHCLLCDKTGRDVKRCEWLKVIEDCLPYSPDPSLDPADGTCQIAGRTTIIDEED